jgi:hypothetical protein
MKGFIALMLLATTLLTPTLHRCPCQETRKPDDKKVFACNGDVDCGCQCLDELVGQDQIV